MNLYVIFVAVSLDNLFKTAAVGISFMQGAVYSHPVYDCVTKPFGEA